MSDEQFAIELTRFGRRERRLWAVMAGMAMLFSALFVVEARMIRKAAHPESLTLRRLDIVDEHGTPRVILASPAPPPMRFGEVGRRDGSVSGVLIDDATGTERGGYVTSDGGDANALLTLDAQG
jgi:hypothetical protein